MVNLNDDVHYTYAGAYQIDKNFNPAMGFIQRTEHSTVLHLLSIQNSPKSGLIDYMDFELDTRLATNLKNRIDNWDIEPGIEIETKSGEEFEIVVAVDRENLFQDFSIADDIIISAADYHFARTELSFETSAHRKVAVETEFGYVNSTMACDTSYEGSIIWRPSPHLSLSSSLSQNEIDLPKAELTARLLR